MSGLAATLRPMEDHESAVAAVKCRYCGRFWPESSFRTARGGVTTHCQACLEAKRLKTRLKRERIGPGGVRAANLWDKYRITPEQYDSLREAQGYRCKICGTHEDDIIVIRTGRPRLDGNPLRRRFASWSITATTATRFAGCCAAAATR